MHSEGWRVVLNASEDWIKNTEKWPASLERKQNEVGVKGSDSEEKQKQVNGIGRSPIGIAKKMTTVMSTRSTNGSESLVRTSTTTPTGSAAT